MSKENVCQAALNTKLPLPKFHDGDHDGGVHYDADDDPDEEFLPAPRLLVFKSACEITPPTEAPSKAAAFDVTAAPAAPPAPGAEAAAQEPQWEHAATLVPKATPRKLRRLHNFLRTRQEPRQTPPQQPWHLTLMMHLLCHP
jgi:hypothetical protein